MSLRVNSKVEVYSETKKKWQKGKVVKRHNDEKGEWVTVKYDDGRRMKELKSVSRCIRPIQTANQWEKAEIVKYKDVPRKQDIPTPSNEEESLPRISDHDLKNLVKGRDDQIEAMQQKIGNLLQPLERQDQLKKMVEFERMENAESVMDKEDKRPIQKGRHPRSIGRCERKNVAMRSERKWPIRRHQDENGKNDDRIAELKRKVASWKQRKSWHGDCNQQKSESKHRVTMRINPEQSHVDYIEHLKMKYKKAIKQKNRMASRRR